MKKTKQEISDGNLREDLIRVLRDGCARITFKKADGTTRVMTCTLDGRIVPPATGTGGQSRKGKKLSENVLNVWDVENSGWRSFRIDSVEEVVSPWPAAVIRMGSEGL